LTPTPTNRSAPSPRGFFWKLLGTSCLIGLLAIGVSVAPIGRFLQVIGWLGVLAAAWWAARQLAASVVRVQQRTAEGTSQLERRVQELESQRTQAQAILESMVEGVAALDRDGRILWLNGSAQRLFKVQPDHAAGKRLLELFRQPELDGLIQEALAERHPAVREVHTFSPTEQVVQFQATPCEDNEAGAALVLVAQDVTEIRRLEGMRREFVANVSHELKTPLTSIKGLVETLLGGALDDSANNRRFVSLIDEDATRLTRLIDDLLELSQIESKALPLTREAVELTPLLEGIVAALEREIEQRRLTVAAQVPPGLLVSADPHRLRQVFMNLVDNAIKYNKDAGRITISAARDRASLTVTVADTGVGIPPQDLPRIFERFYRVDKARSRALGGTGLGLSIVKHIVESHGGTVSVQSRLGEGSAFTITLPLASSARAG